MTYRQELDTKKALEALGAKVSIRHRQLAHRVKTYLTVEADGGHYIFNTIVLPEIRRHFPDAYMTSGGFGETMNVTVALEK